MPQTKKMAAIMGPLFVVQFFTWLGLFALWIYAIPVVTQYVFKATDTNSSDYENGILWVSICFALYSLLAAFIAFSFSRIIEMIGRYKLHAVALLIGSVGLACVPFVSKPGLLLLPFVFIAVAWSSIGNIPYNIISDAAPENKINRYMLIFNFSVVIPQTIAALFLNYLTHHLFRGDTRYTLLFGGCSMALGGFIMLLLKENKMTQETE